VYGKLFFQVVQILPEMLVCLLQVIDRATGMKYGCVVFSSAMKSNVGQRTFGHFLGEVHGNLSRLHDLTFPCFGLE
jgi:hypothetical protein